MITTPNNNVFGIAKADQCVCKLVGISDPHWTMAIQVVAPDSSKESLFLQFPHVAYFSGRTIWKGANFHIASPSEYEDFTKEMSKEILNKADDYHLFIAETSDAMRVLIFAAAAARSDNATLIPYGNVS
jgi:hypothetical protein